MANVGIEHKYDFQYWTPCILKFNADFADGKFIDENCLLSFGANQFLNTLVTGAAREDAPLQGGQLLYKTEGFLKGVPLLEKLAKAQQPEGELNTLSASDIQAKRAEIFTTEEKVWELANSILKRPPIEVRKNAQGVVTATGDFSKCHEWFNRLESVFARQSGSNVISTIVGGRSTLISLKEADALLQPVTVGNKSLSGYLVSQPFIVTGVDKDGHVSLLSEALITDIFEPGNQPQVWKAVLTMEKNEAKRSYYLEGMFETVSDVARAIYLSPVE